MLEVTDAKTGKLTGKYNPMVEMASVNSATGEVETTAYTPEDAVKRMKDDKDTWGNLFRSPASFRVSARERLPAALRRVRAAGWMRRRSTSCPPSSTARFGPHTLSGSDSIPCPRRAANVRGW